MDSQSVRSQGGLQVPSSEKPHRQLIYQRLDTENIHHLNLERKRKS